MTLLITGTVVIIAALCLGGLVMWSLVRAASQQAPGPRDEQEEGNKR